MFTKIKMYESQAVGYVIMGVPFLLL